MRKILLVGLVFVAFAAMSPVHAETASGLCVVPGQGDAGEQTCSYTATGAGTVTQATPNAWSVYVKRLNPDTNAVEDVELAGSDTLGFPGSASFASEAGETVYVSLHRDCAPGNACGNLGFVAAGNS